jgi:exodeoxyribonuclease III
LKITTWNVNGLRAALRKGFASYLDEIQPDVLLLQEVRATPDQLDPEWRAPNGWHVCWNAADKKGYSGTAVWSRTPFDSVTSGTVAGTEDNEGRLLTVTTAGVAISSVYLPSGSSSLERQAVKDEWLVQFRQWTDSVKGMGPCLFGGDLNIAYTENDIFHAKSNQTTSGFLPHEREWFGSLLESGWHDLVREHFGDVPGPYSWWSNRGRARELDRGWRIDYLMANPEIRSRFVGAEIHREAGITVSDHAPVSVVLE